MVYIIFTVIIIVLIILLVVQRSREVKLDVHEYKTDNNKVVHTNIIDSLHGHHDKTQAVHGNLSEDLLFEKVQDHLRLNQKIQAVKLVRESLGIGLAEAKRWVDNVERTMW